MNQPKNLSICWTMLSDILVLVLGLALLIKGGDWFVAASVRIAKALGMPRVVIGSTLVSLATTTPELMVSIVAGSESDVYCGRGRHTF